MRSDAISPDPKACAHCGTIFGRRKTKTINPRFCESTQKFYRRKYCCLQCMAAANTTRATEKNKNRIDLPRHCGGCGGVLIKKPTEARVAFLRRRHCNPTCLGKYRSSRPTRNRLASCIRARKIMADELRKQTCAACGKDPASHLEVHHIDNDPFNNQKDNLQILCRNCHMRHHGKIKTNIAKQVETKCIVEGCTSKTQYAIHRMCSKHHKRVATWGHHEVTFNKSGKQLSGPPVPYIKGAASTKRFQPPVITAPYLRRPKGI